MSQGLRRRRSICKAKALKSRGRGIVSDRNGLDSSSMKSPLDQSRLRVSETRRVPASGEPLRVSPSRFSCEESVAAPRHGVLLSGAAVLELEIWVSDALRAHLDLGTFRRKGV